VSQPDIQLHRFFGHVGIGAEDEDGLHGLVKI
jgi:hypothetical protein